MRLARGGLAVVCLASLLAGCGIGAGPVRVEDRPADLTLGDSGNRLASLARPDQAQNAAELVSGFLRAAADHPETRPDTLRSYLGKGRANWAPGDKINVVRILSGPDAGPLAADRSVDVTVQIQRIGELVNGRIVPVNFEPEKLKFRAREEGSAGLFLDPPNSTELFLPDESLKTRYEDRLLYFRAADGRLVTDLRYVPRYLSEEEKADRLITWLYDGAAPWLEQAVSKLPPATRPNSRVVADPGGTLVVNLAAPLPEADLAELAEQLYRTLVVLPVTGLEITIQGQPEQKPDPPSSPSRYPVSRYAVVDGQVVRLGRATHSGKALQLPPDANKDVLSVAFSRGEESVALVRRQGATQTLWAGPVGRPQPVELPGRPAQISQPVWLDHRSSVLLVLVDGKLFHVARGVATQVQGVSNIEAMSVAPDGYRLALVVNGELKMAALIRPADGPILVGSTQQRVPVAFERVQNVAFGANHSLVVAGTDVRGTRIVLMNIDGALQSAGGEELAASLRVSQLVSDPQSGAILYEIRDVNSYELLSTGSIPLWYDVVGLGAPAEIKVRAPSFEG